MTASVDDIGSSQQQQNDPILRAPLAVSQSCRADAATLDKLQSVLTLLPSHTHVPQLHYQVC